MYISNYPNKHTTIRIVHNFSLVCSGSKRCVLILLLHVPLPDYYLVVLLLIDHTHLVMRFRQASVNGPWM